MHTRLYGLTHPTPRCRRGRSPSSPTRSPSSSATRLRATACGRTGACSARAATGAAIVLLDNPFWPQYARRDIASVAAERGQQPLDAVYDLLLAGSRRPSRLMVLIHAYTADEQREAFAHPLCVPGSDATTLAPDGPLADTWFHGAYTWASWFYRFMVRDEGLRPGGGLHKLRAQPAARLGLRARACSPGRRRRRGLRPAALRRPRDYVRAEPARRGRRAGS